MKTWNNRPREVRTLFNPAFCGLILARGIEGYAEVSGRAMPFSLSLLILPLCLHERTRNQIKEGSRSYFAKILQDHPEIRVDLPRRTKGLFPYAMEAFSYLADRDVLAVDPQGCLSVLDGKVRRAITGTQESRDCQMAARSLGKKFSQIGDRATIYTTLGIRP